MPFVKGKSGNPNGRPKLVEDFRAKCRKAVDDTVISAWIREVETQGDNWPKASELLAAYGYGKPSQPVEHSAPGDESISVSVNFVSSGVKEK